jgi:hypothetical protein
MLKATAGCIATFAIVLVFADYALSIPEVYKSYSTNECQKVESYPGLIFGQETFSCENMPTKFSIVWTR